MKEEIKYLASLFSLVVILLLAGFGVAAVYEMFMEQSPTVTSVPAATARLYTNTPPRKMWMALPPPTGSIVTGATISVVSNVIYITVPPEANKNRIYAAFWNWMQDGDMRVRYREDD